MARPPLRPARKATGTGPDIAARSHAAAAESPGQGQAGSPIEPDAILAEFESVLRDEPGVGQEGLDFLMPFLRDAVQQASLQPARAELHPAAWMAALDSLIGEDVDEAERNALARQLNAAIEPMTDPKAGLALEFANRIQTEGHQAALDWLQRQRAAGEGEDPAPAPAPVGGAPANAQSIIRSRSRRLRGPPV